jgi:hypothetical protein
MKKLLIACAMLLTLNMWAAQHTVELDASATTLDVLNNDNLSVSLFYAVDQINAIDVTTERGDFAEISVPGYSHNTALGQAKLPVLRKLIAVPLGARIVLDAQNQSTEEVQLSDWGITHALMPVQPSVSKSADPASIKFAYDEAAYQLDGFTQNKLVEVEEVGIMRGVRLVNLVFSPVRYNPVRNSIQVYNNVTVTVNFEDADMAATDELRKKTWSPFFEAMYQQQIINYQPLVGRDEITQYPIKYVIVADRMFETQLEPFALWKTQCGYQTETVFTDEIGTSTTAIKTYLQGLWDAATPDDPAPSFVLFVGDTGQVPAWNGSTGSHITDLNYVLFEGNDKVPEMYYGRFSANNAAELQPQIDKTMMYQKYEMPDPSYLAEVVMIAGMDGSHGNTWGNGQINYGTTNYFNAAHGITSHTYLYPQSGSNSANIIQNVSDGVAYINYTAHGSSTTWVDPSFTIANINGLQNSGQYCVAVGNCCLTNKFETPTCFGEAWLRAEDKGAVGYIGGTNVTYWDEDYYFGVGAGNITANPTYAGTGLGAYDGIFHDHGEPFGDWYTTTGGIIYRGNLAVTEGGGNYNYYWEIYALMGDPSLTPYMGVPTVNNATFPSTIFIGQTSITITAEPYSYVGLSMDGDIYGSGLVGETGTLVLDIDPFFVPGNATLVINAQNKEPRIETVEVIPNNGPYVVVDAFTVSAGGDDVIEYGETASLSVDLENVGTDPASNVTMTIATSDAYITITDDNEPVGNVNAGQVISLTNAFAFTVANDVPDNHSFMLDVTCTGDEGTWTGIIALTAYAPEIGLENIMISDGDNNRLDPGDTADMIITLKNNGGALANNVAAMLSSTNSDITINTASATIASLVSGAATPVTLNVTVSAAAQIGDVADFALAISADNDYTAQELFSFSIGLCLEDFETGDFSAYPWDSSGNAEWAVSDAGAYEGTYSAQSGDISDNQSSSLEVELDVLLDGEISFMKKVSSESGWDFLKFYIDGQQQGSWSGTVDWSEETYPVTAGTHTFKWSYTKDSSQSSGSDCAWIDYIIFPTIGYAAPAQILVNTNQIDVNMASGATATENFEISNIGGAELTYSIMIEETTDAIRKSIEGSYVECSADDFIPGQTVTWDITAFNGSPDSEWLTLVSIDFPAGVNVTSSTDLLGGDGPLITTNATGNGVTVEWVDDDGGYGNIHGNETAQAQVTVTIDAAFSGDMTLNYHMEGDIWGGEPHELDDAIVLVNTGTTISWVEASPLNGTIAPGQQDDIALNFDTTDLQEGVYTCNVIISSNGGDDVIIPVTLTVENVSSGTPLIPSHTVLNGNYPNPFNPTTSISYALSADANVAIDVYNVRGQKVTSLVNKHQTAGYHTVTWDGSDAAGKPVSSGVYFYKMKAGEYSRINKMMLMK